MIKKLLIIILSFTLYFGTALSEELTIAYIDVDKIINQSVAGKDIAKQLKILNDNNIKKFKQKEKKLADEENNIIKQKNILSKEELEIKVKTLRKNLGNFKINIKNSRNDLDQKRLDATKKILNILNPILSEYSSKNSISLIIQKKIIVIGKSEMDITPQILKLLNEKIKNIKL